MASQKQERIAPTILSFSFFIFIFIFSFFFFSPSLSLCEYGECMDSVPASMRPLLRYPYCRIAKGLPKLYNCQHAFPVSEDGLLNASFYQFSQPIGYIVKIKDELSPENIDRICTKAESEAATYEGKCVLRFKSLWLGMLITMSGHHLKQLLREEGKVIEYVEVEGDVQLSLTQMKPPWGLDRIDKLPGQKPLNQMYNVSLTGSGINIYIMDTGIRCSHTDFQYLDGRLDARGKPMSRCLNGFDTINDGRGNVDCHGHGTHCAGIAAGLKSGVAKDAFLHSVRVMFCDGSGKYGTILAGISWIYDNLMTPAVISMSIATSASLSIDNAVNRIVGRPGVVAVAASGNFLQSSCNYSPSRALSAISVASSNIGNTMSWFSNFGNCTSIFAPGENIISAYQDSDTSFHSLSGTSMACPHVAGAAALYLQANTEARPAEVRQAIFDSSEPKAISNVKEETTTRLLNVNNLDNQLVEIKPRSIYNASEGKTYKVIVRLIVKPKYVVVMTPKLSNPTIGVFSPSRLVFSANSRWYYAKVMNIVVKKYTDFFDRESLISWTFSSRDPAYTRIFEGYIISRDSDICRYTPANPCGQDIENPKIIPVVPFAYYGDTSKYSDSYDKDFDPCLSDGPDMTFQYTPKTNMVVRLSLCDKDTTFDSILIIFEKITFFSRKYVLKKLSCNDDFCNVQSSIPEVQLLKGHTYIIIVDGYKGEEGEYYLAINKI